jgi:hypothetical protein
LNIARKLIMKGNILVKAELMGVRTTAQKPASPYRKTVAILSGGLMFFGRRDRFFCQPDTGGCHNGRKNKKAEYGLIGTGQVKGDG